jgi:hypothetical protein
MQAVKDLCKGLDLPKPTIVNSGRGWHVYWPLTEPVETSKWLPVAHTFKARCKELNIIIDPDVPADAARVLRIPGTKNFKDDPAHDVVLMHTAEPMTFEDFVAKMGPMVQARPAYMPKQLDEFTKAMLGNRQSRFRTIFDKTMAGGEGERNGVSVQEADVVLLEGWLTGCRALATADLARALQGGGTRSGAKGGQEREGWLQLTEAERAWLPSWNGALRAYSEIWDRLDGLWVLKPTQWTWPRRWRFQAEARQRRAGGGWLPARDLEALVRSSLASLPPALYQDPLLDPIQGPSAGMTNERLAGTTHDPTIAPIGAEVVALIDSRRRCRWSGLTQDCPIRPATTFQLSSESASSATG